jgi:ABC-type sugar transport system ATPase subunit
MTNPMLAALNVGVRFGATLALDGIDLELRSGEVHAVVGENGAGKSTLLRVLAGVLAAEQGRVEAPETAHVAWVPQDALLPGDLTVAAWIFLGCERCGRFGWLCDAAMQRESAAALAALGCTVDPRARLRSLSLPQRKQVQLARALRRQPDFLLLDEPTAVLGDVETHALFARIRDLRHHGAGILYVSHRLAEVLAIADRITVLRDGRHVSTDPVNGVDTAVLVQRMVGRAIAAQHRSHRALGEIALRMTDLSAAHVQHVSLTVRHGEIVGLAGLVGAGRSELLEAIARLRPLRGGHVECMAPPAFVPEDRGRKGLVPTSGLRDNLFLPADTWVLRPARERARTRQWIARLGIRTAGIDAPIHALSGGNQQKLLLARALRHESQLLLLDEPTAGVDVGAKAEIHALIHQLAVAGTAIVLASSDLPELLLLSDRIVAMRAGQCMGEVAGADATEPYVAALITGADHE